MLINNHQHLDLGVAEARIHGAGLPPGWSATVLKADSDELATPGEGGRVAMDLQGSSLAWFQGYVSDPGKSAEKFTADGRWYLTGDVGRMDEQGYFYFSSRQDDVIILAGYRIGAVDVESVLLAHPAVAECVVVATPDEICGEVLEAVVMLKPEISGGEQLARELQSKVKMEFAAHAYPRRVHFVDALPKTASGKIQRYLVRQRLREGSLAGGQCAP